MDEYTSYWKGKVLRKCGKTEVLQVLYVNLCLPMLEVETTDTSVGFKVFCHQKRKCSSQVETFEKSTKVLLQCLSQNKLQLYQLHSVGDA